MKKKDDNGLIAKSKVMYASKHICNGIFFIHCVTFMVEGYKESHHEKTIQEKRERCLMRELPIRS